LMTDIFVERQQALVLHLRVIHMWPQKTQTKNQTKNQD
jgi:hypothetical protein